MTTASVCFKTPSQLCNRLTSAVPLVSTVYCMCVVSAHVGVLITHIIIESSSRLL